MKASEQAEEAAAGFVEALLAIEGHPDLRADIACLAFARAFQILKEEKGFSTAELFETVDPLTEIAEIPSFP